MRIKSNAHQDQAANTLYAAKDESFHADVCLQLLHTRSPGQDELKSLRHIKHLRTLLS